MIIFIGSAQTVKLIITLPEKNVLDVQNHLMKQKTELKVNPYNIPGPTIADTVELKTIDKSQKLESSIFQKNERNVLTLPHIKCRMYANFQ